MNRDTKRCKSLPIKDTMNLKCVIQILNILYAFPQYKEGCISKHSPEEAINKDLPWAFFD
jgi:hypothetical protein